MSAYERERAASIADKYISKNGGAPPETEDELDARAQEGDDKAAIAKLARMSELAYQKARKAKAEALGLTMGALDKLVARQRKARPATKAPPAPVDVAALKKSAAPLIECKDVLEHFVAAFSKVMAGEKRNAKFIYLIATSRLLPKTMHAAIKGTSAGGKSEMRARILDFFPPEAVVSFTSLSEKSLIYYDGDFAHKILSMGEAVATDEQDFQDYLLRELMSEGRLRHQTVQKVGNDIVSVTIEKEGPVTFLVTTTKNKLHPENETRMLSLEIDDSEAQTKAVLRKVAEVEGMNRTGALVAYEPWRDFQRWLAAGERRVVVPFAEEMVKLIPPKSVRLRRDVGQVIRAIKAHALLHREHRQQDERGIIADIENDYATVRELMNDLLAESSGVAVHPAMNQTIDAVRQACLTSTVGGASALAVGQILKLDKSAARRRLLAAQADGFVVNLEDRRGQPGRYSVTGQKVEVAEMLPPVDRLTRAHLAATPSKSAPPCHRSTKIEDVLEDSGGKALCHRSPPVATTEPPATGLATGSSFNSNDLTPPVARWHANLTSQGDAPALGPPGDALDDFQ
jgi:hypothetical protein